MQTISDTAQKQCTHCERYIVAASSFCNHCGAIQLVEDRLTSNKWSQLKQVSFFYGLHLVLCCMFKFINIFHTLSYLSAYYVASSLLTLIFIGTQYSDSRHFLNWKRFHTGRLALYSLGAVLGSVVVSYSVNWLNQIIFPKTVFYDVIFAGHRHSYGLIILFSAVLPAICEELAYRGYILQSLLKIVDKQQAIFITSFVFAIAHLNFLSLFWLIPFSLLLGYIRVHSKTIWYGVAIHFLFNLTACLIESITR